jgi:hypothetical protein
MREYRELMTQQRTKATWATGLGIAAVLVLCVGAALVARTALSPTPEPTSTETAPVTVAPATPTPATTPVPVNTATPVPTDTPAPTETPALTPIPTTTPAPGPSPTSPPSPTPSLDPAGDISVYVNGNPVEQDRQPDGADIRTASVSADLRVVLQPAEGVPAELAGWATGDEILLWISVHDPVPDPPAAFIDWAFVLDLDGDVSTGRPAGAVRVNPDLGYEAAIGVSYDTASGEYEPYFLVWAPEESVLVLGPEAPRFTMNESRTLIGLALPLETLAKSVEQTTGVTVVPSEVKGRAAVVSVAGHQRVVDFYPDRPN